MQLFVGVDAGRCNYGGNSRHAGFDTEQPARQQIRRAFARKQPLCPSVRRPTVEGGAG